jgi:parallel beta-helix repeat protein
MYPDGLTQMVAYPGPTPPTYFNTFIVSPFGGHFPSINAAIAACPAPGAMNQYLIEVMPGTYFENVNCPKFISLRGAGKYASTINGVVIAADSCVIEGFYITQGVQCPGTSPTLINNIITNTMMGGNGITIMTPGKPWIRENEINKCLGWGIMATGFNCDGWFIDNKVMHNMMGGIRLADCSPTISNNIIDNNQNFGIFMSGGIGTPAEPTISDNVISNTGYVMGGRGIYMTGYAEPRIISNDIYLNECGIWIDPNTQPSIIGNNINYNYEAGIRCYSSGASKRVVITSNHIHSNCHAGGFQPAGIWIQECNPIVTLNNITQNSVAPAMGLPVIDYSMCMTIFPTISTNIYDIINRPGGGPGPGPAMGIYNSTSMGLAINP